jgi:flavoprotein
MQDVLFRFMRYSAKSDNKLKNLLNTGGKKTDFVSKAAELMFKDYHWYQELENIEEDNNVVSFNESTTKPKLLKDTLKNKFR